MRWLEAVVEAGEQSVEEICATLETLGVEGFCIEDEADFRDFLEKNRQYWDYVDETLQKSYAGVSRVKFYLEDSPAGQAQLQQLRAESGFAIATAIVDDEDWNENWKQYYRPLEIGKKLLVVPEWESPELNGRTALRLDPGLTFGTGSHATTRMCLEALEDYAAPGKQVLDLGCGSGILGIGALVLGCACVVGCDVDPKSPKVAAENAALNGIGPDRFRIYAGDILSDEGMRRTLDGAYDIVCANIVADVITPLSAFVKRFLKPDGVFICSGIIDGREKELASVLTGNGLRILRHMHGDEWNAFVCVP